MHGKASGRSTSMDRLRAPGLSLAALLAGLLYSSLLPAASNRLDCIGRPALVLATGSEGGDCLTEKDARALCGDGAGNAAYARCDRGCLFTNGAGSCTLADEDVVPASLVLCCDGGARYLLRTRTGAGACTTTEEGGVRTARCADGKVHSAAADCRQGCLSPRGQGLCARYKADAGADAADAPPPANP